MPRGTVQGGSSSESTRKRGPRDMPRLTCASCRSRKIKCDGGQPECHICQAYGTKCNYDKPPSVSQVRAMSKKIAELERQLAESKSTKQSLATPRHLETPLLVTTTSPGLQSLISSTGGRQYELPPLESTAALQSRSRAAKAGPDTSLVHDEGPQLLSDERQIEVWGDTAMQACATYLQMSRSRVTQLFQTHWTWVHPVFMFVNRATFLRDAATGGRYFSQLLLCVLCLHSTRFTRSNFADDLEARVRLLLVQDIYSEPTVPTIQALLQLSAMEIGRGFTSQAWLFSGMAFRLAVDRGIFKKASFTVALDARINDQLAWSCFCWDKAISLYLGKVPTLTEAPAFNPPNSHDSIEHVAWRPYYGDNAHTHSESETSSCILSCFRNFCELNTIVSDILVDIYGKKTSRQVPEVISDLRSRLQEWRKMLPPQLAADKWTTVCPAPHIVILNLLFYAATILLHRPFPQSQSCRSICREAAEEIESLFLLYETAYGGSHSTYLMAYCAYIAATVAVIDTHDNVEGARQRVHTFLRALYSTRASCPAIQSGIDIIVNGLTVTPPAPRADMDATTPGTFHMEPNPFPAFLFDHTNDGPHFDVGETEAVPFGQLDAFYYDPAFTSLFDLPNESYNQPN